MRAMFLEFPDDRTAHYLDRQYMLGNFDFMLISCCGNEFDTGPSLLVAPVFVPLGEETEYYIPAGRWTAFFEPTRTIDGPKWVRECIPLDDIPVWVRPGTILALGPEGIGRPDYDYTKGLELRAYQVADESVSVNIPVGKGVAIAGQAGLRSVSEGLEIVSTIRHGCE